MRASTSTLLSPSPSCWKGTCRWFFVSRGTSSARLSPKGSLRELWKRTATNYAPKRSICTGWGGSICRGGSAGEAVAVGLAGLVWRSREPVLIMFEMPDVYGANISCKTARTAVRVPGAIRPSRLTRRSLSTVRIWSTATNPARSRKRQCTRHGYACPPVVMGAMMTVRKC